MKSDEHLNSPAAVFREDRATGIVLSAPQQENRLNERCARALLETVGQVAAGAGTGCLLLEHRGEIFCSGLDYEELSASADLDDVHRLFTGRELLCKPLAAAVHGARLGAGVGLLLQCHFVLAAQGTKFAVSDIHSAVWPGLYYGEMAR